MSPINIWGPTTWTFLHTIVEKMNENDFTRLGTQLFLLIKSICSVLPCPECSQHATQFLATIKQKDIATKTDFKNMIYLFHNAVSSRKKKPLFNHVNIGMYSKIPLQIAFNNFVKVFNTKGNMRLLAESFQRGLVVRNVKNFIILNNKCFSPI